LPVGWVKADAGRGQHALRYSAPKSKCKGKSALYPRPEGRGFTAQAIKSRIDINDCVKRFAVFSY
jgi:hypothetical protein